MARDVCHCWLKESCVCVAAKGERPMLFTITGLRRAGHVLLARAKPISSATAAHPRDDEALLQKGEAYTICYC